MMISWPSTNLIGLRSKSESVDLLSEWMKKNDDAGGHITPTRRVGEPDAPPGNINNGRLVNPDNNGADV